MIEKINVGIIGAGGIAQEHLKVLKDLEDVEIVALCNRGEKRRVETAEKFDIPRIYANYHDMLKNHEFDALFILVSVLNMKRVTLDCSKLGIPLFVEKPIGLSVEDAKTIQETAHQYNTKIMVGVNRRFVSTIMKAKELVGNINGINIEAPERYINEVESGFHPPEVLDRWIYVNGVHCIDLLRYFGGDVKEIVSVSSKSKHYYNSQMVLENCPAQYRSYWDCPGGWRVTLYGDKTTVELFPLEKGIVKVRGQEPQVFTLEEIDKKYKPGFYKQARYFVDFVKEKKPFAYPASDIDDAVKTMYLIKKIELI